MSRSQLNIDFEPFSSHNDHWPTLPRRQMPVEVPKHGGVAVETPTSFKNTFRDLFENNDSKQQQQHPQKIKKALAARRPKAKVPSSKPPPPLPSCSKDWSSSHTQKEADQRLRDFLLSLPGASKRGLGYV